MKVVPSTLLFAGTFVAIPLIGFSLVILALSFVKVQLALNAVTVNLHTCATSVEALAAAVILDPQNLFAVAPTYILEINYFNTGLEKLILALPILNTAVASIKTSDPGNLLPGNLDDVAVGLNDIAGGLFSLTTTVTSAAVDSQATLINTDYLKQDFMNAYTNLVKIATDVKKTAEAIEKIAAVAGNGYVNTVRLAITISNIIGAMKHAAGASSCLSDALRGKVSSSGGAAASLTQTANDLNDVKNSLITTADALSLP